MLCIGPWCRLPLVVRWMSEEFIQEFSPGLEPPLHMPVITKAVKTAKLPRSDVPEVNEQLPAPTCALCRTSIAREDRLSCLFPQCQMSAHIICLASRFLGDSPCLLPVDGTCPSCSNTLLWGDLVRFKNGCYRDLQKDLIQIDVTQLD